MTILGYFSYSCIKTFVVMLIRSASGGASNEYPQHVFTQNWRKLSHNTHQILLLDNSSTVTMFSNKQNGIKRSRQKDQCWHISACIFKQFDQNPIFHVCIYLTTYEKLQSRRRPDKLFSYFYTKPYRFPLVFGQTGLCRQK